MNSSRPSPVPEPSREQLQQRYSGYYKNRGDVSSAPFADVGDQFKLHGDNAIVRHVEKNHDGSQDLTVQRSVRGNSGTYKVTVKPDAQRTQVVTKVKRSFD